MPAPVDATPFWKPWEYAVDSLETFNNVLEKLYTQWMKKDHKVFAWRGVTNARWALHSSLYRKYAEKAPGWPGESELARTESKIIREIHRWGLHHGDHGRLGVLEQLAMLQHFGGSTRLIDITFNAYIALWFAVESVDGDAEDGRVFAIDVSERMINDDDALRGWEDRRVVPWSRDADWQVRALAWRPAPLDRRIAAQQGGFLLGGVPSSAGPNGPIQWPKSTSPKNKWTISDVRSFVSVPVRMHKLAPSGGGVGRDGWPAYTFRISAEAKPAMRARLGKMFGYRARILFPDYAGFATHAAPRIVGSS